MKINYEPKMNESVIDSIVRLLNKGHSESDIYDFIESHCSMTMSTEAQKTSMRNHIAKLSAMNVFAIGEK